MVMDLLLCTMDCGQARRGWHISHFPHVHNILNYNVLVGMYGDRNPLGIEHYPNLVVHA